MKPSVGKAVIGVDPGVNGGVAWMVPQPNGGRGIGCAPLNGFDDLRGHIKDVMAMADGYGIVVAGFAEKLQPRMNRKRGSIGTWKLAISYTEAICALRVEIGEEPYLIKPAAWQKALGNYGATKIERREIARKWYPQGNGDDVDSLHGLCDQANKVAESLMIAEYGWRVVGNTL